MIAAIRVKALRRGITRLCHFTPSRNLVHIVTDPQGLLATQSLTADERAVFNPTDLARFDGHRDHVCCSVQYPNAWYFRNARGKDAIFRDWVVLLLEPRHLWAHGTKFCPRNAAAAGGRLVAEGLETFEAMFAPEVVGAYGKTYARGPSRLPSIPTDDQAEVLIPDRVARGDVLAIVVVDESQAKREIARLQTLDERVPRVLIAPEFFDAHRLSSMLRRGVSPKEEQFYAGDSDG